MKRWRPPKPGPNVIKPPLFMNLDGSVKFPASEAEYHAQLEQLLRRPGTEIRDYLKYLVETAQNGDWEPLADHLEGGGPIDEEIQKFLVTVLRKGSSERRNKTWVDRKYRALVVLRELKAGAKITDAVEEAADKCGVSSRHIWRDIQGIGLGAASPRSEGFAEARGYLRVDYRARPQAEMADALGDDTRCQVPSSVSVRRED